LECARTPEGIKGERHSEINRERCLWEKGERERNGEGKNRKTKNERKKH